MPDVADPHRSSKLWRTRPFHKHQGKFTGHLSHLDKFSLLAFENKPTTLRRKLFHQPTRFRPRIASRASRANCKLWHPAHQVSYPKQRDNECQPGTYLSHPGANHGFNLACETMVSSKSFHVGFLKVCKFYNHFAWNKNWPKSLLLNLCPRIRRPKNGPKGPKSGPPLGSAR